LPNLPTILELIIMQALSSLNQKTYLSSNQSPIKTNTASRILPQAITFKSLFTYMVDMPLHLLELHSAARARIYNTISLISPHFSLKRENSERIIFLTLLFASNLIYAYVELYKDSKFDAFYEEGDCEHYDYMSAEDYERREYYRTHD
jgi:hypothetical protein